MNLAPIVLFVYNRPNHTRLTIEALQKNGLASASQLFIYSDGAKNDAASLHVRNVREYLQTIEGFKKITIIEREKNLGLDLSIMDGVSSLLKQYDKIIVLEDDIVTSPYFLKFMNEALSFYEKEMRVWHISGWNYPVMLHNIEDAFLWRLMNCWGWGTWANRWSLYEQDLAKSIQYFSKKDIERFNVKYGNFWEQVHLNLKKKDTNWDIRWYATIFNNSGLCLNPCKTLVKNIGLDGSGIHCGTDTTYDNDEISLSPIVQLPDTVCENCVAVSTIEQFFKLQKKSLFTRIINKLARICMRQNIIK